MTLVKYKERKNTNCIKWDGLEGMYSKSDLLAMWVADMDFQVPECVQNALHEYVAQGTFGYHKVPDGYYEAFIDWEKKHHKYDVKKEWIRFSPGVVAAFNWIVEFMTKPGESIIVQTPVYYPIIHAAKDRGRNLVESKLINEKGTYHIDFRDFEKKIIDNDVKLFILCSPHNPVGRVWTKEELSRLMEICRKHEVFVISDEIHHDLVYGNYEHIPTLSLGNYEDMVFMLTAPSKTFNLAACQNSVIVIPDEKLRTKWDDFVKTLHVDSGNAFGYIAAEAAYREGTAWLEELCENNHRNFNYLKEQMKEKLPKAVVSELEGTYLAWIDMGAYLKSEDMHFFMEEKCGLAFDYGDWFGGDEYACFVRMNLATSKENVKRAIEKMTKNIPGAN